MSCFAGAAEAKAYGWLHRVAAKPTSQQARISFLISGISLPNGARLMASAGHGMALVVPIYGTVTVKRLTKLKSKAEQCKYAHELQPYVGRRI
jgi:murein endopeptidase